MSKPHILLDLDDTLYDHFNLLMHWHNSQFSSQLTLADNHPFSNRHWGTPALRAATLKRWSAGSVEQAIKRVQEFFETKEFTDSRPFTGAHQVLKELSNTHELIVVTARDLFLEEFTNRWLDEHFAGLISEVYLTARCSLDGRAQLKIDVIKKLGAEYLIDDDIELCSQAAKIGVKSILFGEYPWNYADSLPDGVSRRKDWKAVGEYFGV